MLVKQQRKCLHITTCLLLSCLLLLLEWQATLATPILTKATTPTTKTSATRRLRVNERPSTEKLHRSRVGGVSSSPCEHKRLSELIKTSPVILKALGAHIFNHDDDEDLRILHNSNDALLLKWQNEQNKVLTSLKRTEKLHKKLQFSTLSLPSTESAEKTRQQQNKQTHTESQQQSFSDAATNRAAMLASMNADAILITLTPETIYKGASLLKMTSNAAEHATLRSASSSSSSKLSSGTIGSSSGSGGGGGGTSSGLNSGTINSSEASYLYEGQLNATVQPLSCFDENLLEMLPSDLIIFGKLITIDEQQQQMQQTEQQQQNDDLIMNLHDFTSSSSTAQRQTQQSTKDILKISINGLHRWSSQFENYIWKHLGWDDWSDFTVCSVACGKGVQQRFRRCLLDNPMVNLNMNFYNDNNEDIDVDVDVDTDVVVEMDWEDNLTDEQEEYEVNDWDESEQQNKIDNNNGLGYSSLNEKNLEKTFTTSATTSANVANHRDQNSDNMLLQTENINTGNMLHFVTTPHVEVSDESPTTADNEPEIMRIFEGHFNDTYKQKTSASATIVGKTLTIKNENSKSASASAASAIPLRDAKNIKNYSNRQQQLQQKIKHKKHKSAKLFSTMFCEGYNIEQRNCNSFECSDDISDLLKFYRKYSTTDEMNTAPTQAMIMDSNAETSSLSNPSSTTLYSEFDETDQNSSQNPYIFTTPINMGYILNWHNTLNFTIMLTLRVKNDSYTTATIFSIRNSTHNLYLESCRDGLRLYLERDKTTEMLPIKFNLYDYHWHQVAISIQNGDFISIHNDCSWTNSFVVSKRLYSLPVAADVEIGRGFNGELQQLLILPENQERYQCSEKRVSINEVKRYIIDTFIDDYAN